MESITQQAPSTKNTAVRKFLTRNDFTTLNDLLYFSNRAPYAYCMFLKFKIPVRGTRCQNISNTEAAVITVSWNSYHSF